MVREVAITVSAISVALGATLAINTALKTSRQPNVAPVPHVAVDANAAAQRLAGAVRFQTITYDDKPDASADEFLKLHAYLEKTFPRAHAVMKREQVAGYSLLYTWPGTDPAAKGTMLMAHQDVVPVADGTERKWQVPPFAGTIRDGYVWGRGSWDNKSNLLAMLEAIETLAASGFQPRQTIYLAAGHDEESGGDRGARKIAELLQSRGVRLSFVVDEGTLVTEGIMKGLDAPVALVGVEEKGLLTVSLHAHQDPGHSSMPPRETAIGMIADALARLEQNPMPGAIRTGAEEMFDTLAPEMRGVQRLVLSNLWLFKPLVKLEMEKGRSSDAMLRTTTALTTVHAGNKVNVIPAEAHAHVNFRIIPGENSSDVLRHVHKVVDNPAVAIGKKGVVSESSPVTRGESPSYRLMAKTIREVFPGTVVAPGLMVGATDARYMQAIAEHVFRFSPVRAREEDLPRFHGTDERISLRNYAEMIAFYHRLVQSASASLTGEAKGR